MTATVIVGRFFEGGVVLHKMLDQKGDIFFTFPERRQVNGDNVDAVEEILPHQSLFHLLFQIFIGGSNDAKIGGFRFKSAYWRESPPSIARSSLACRLGPISPNSSRKSVPLSADWSRPRLFALAPVKAPFL